MTTGFRHKAKLTIEEFGAPARVESLVLLYTEILKKFWTKISILSKTS